MKIENAIALSRLILRFGQTFRITEDVEGRQESDTTHSIILALMAGEMAEAEGLDRGTVVSLSLIHDIAEVYAGDTATLRALTPDQQCDKDARESAALAQVRQEIQGFPWVLSLIERYEAQACPESRFVKYLDKVLPKLTHRDNGIKVPKSHGMTHDEFIARHAQQGADLRRKYPEFPSVGLLFFDACADCESHWSGK